MKWLDWSERGCGKKRKSDRWRQRPQATVSESMSLRNLNSPRENARIKRTSRISRISLPRRARKSFKIFSIGQALQKIAKRREVLAENCLLVGRNKDNCELDVGISKNPLKWDNIFSERPESEITTVATCSILDLESRK